MKSGTIIMGLLVIIMLVLLIALTPAGAQTGAPTLRAALERLSASDITFTVQFRSPLPTGETLWTLPEGARRVAEVGEDYVCFSEPWNDGSRRHCTPFSNIVSISYLTP